MSTNQYAVADTSSLPVIATWPGNCRSELRALARRFKRRSLHFNELLPAQRAEAIELFNHLPVDAAHVYEHSRTSGESEIGARSVVVTALVQRLQTDGITRMRLDHFQGADKIDGPTIRQARSVNRSAELHYDHAYFSDEQPASG